MRSQLIFGALTIFMSSFFTTAQAASPSADSPFAIRGMKGLFWEGIENYNNAIPWMADHNMNWLMLCYTMYPESAREWRKDYTPRQKAEMAELVTRANDKGVTICLSFNPGIWSNPPLKHSSEEDYQAAWRKVQMAHDIGIYEIALCLDDIAKGIPPEDKEKYGTLEAAQMAFTNRMWADMQNLSPRPKLIFCPSAYTTEDMEKYPDYTRFIGEHLAPGIEIFWTGRQVCSPAITVEHAREAEKHFKRKPFVWDNYPVNDMFPWRPLLSPVKGRDPELAGAISGILFNPMKQWNINRIPMAAVADYLNDPVNYDPAKARKKILNDFPAADRPAVELLMNYYGHSFWGEKSFPPAPRITTQEGASVIHDDLVRLRDLLQATTSSLKAMWPEIKGTVETDIKYGNMYEEGPVTTGNFLTGGAPDLAAKAFGESMGLVYAEATGKSRMTMPVNVTVPYSRIRLFARNSDGTKPRIRITLNGQVVHEGVTEFSQQQFEPQEYSVKSVDKSATPELIIENLETNGSLGVPPWFAVKWIQFLP